MEETNSYQVLVCNIHWGAKANSPVTKKVSETDLPEQISLDVPAGVLVEIQKKPTEESSIIESFVLNLLYKKFGHEINNCQIWLPLKD